METPIQVHDLSILYRDKKAVQGLSFQVRRGEIFGFLGPNGAGKSSTLKCLLGLVRPSSGSVLLHGYPASDPRARVSIGFMPEEATYPRYLTPMEILIHYAALFGIDRRRAKVRADEMLELTGLTSFSGKRLSTLSKGTVQKVSLAQALINDPQTLILDEPTTGLDPLAKDRLRTILMDLRAKGKTVFFSSHELSEAETMCDSILILRAGRVLRQGSLQSLLDAQKGESLERFFVRTVSAP